MITYRWHNVPPVRQDIQVSVLIRSSHLKYLPRTLCPIALQFPSACLACSNCSFQVRFIKNGGWPKILRIPNKSEMFCTLSPPRYLDFWRRLPNKMWGQIKCFQTKLLLDLAKWMLILLELLPQLTQRSGKTWVSLLYFCTDPCVCLSGCRSASWPWPKPATCRKKEQVTQWWHHPDWTVHRPGCTASFLLL